MANSSSSNPPAPRPTSIGPYPIERELGRGGMGVVYLARDMRLERPVAVKVLPADFARDPTRLARFEREARSLAALNHPNIAAIYSIETAPALTGAGNETLLVLEYIPGRTLTDLVYRGPMPLDEALRLCLQMTEGIEVAHERGVVHRDLKPDNVRITPDGVAKILDFGLATTGGGKDEEHEHHVSESASTRALGLTQFGMVMGTPGYMSPEQARGLTVDKRTDIWAFGCILFEVLTGARAFTGETTSDCIAAVIDKEPDWSLLPVTTPNRVRELLRKCLTKETRRRLRDIGDARIDIEDVLSQPMSGMYRAAATDGSGPTRSRVVARLTLKLPAHMPLSNAPARSLAVSPDGSSIAYITGDNHHAHLAIRKLEEQDPRQAAGTAGAERPFYSPDSQKLAYFAGGRLRRVPISGGMPNVLAQAPRPQGGVWDATERICFVPDWGAPLMRMPAMMGLQGPMSTIGAASGPGSGTGSGFAGPGSGIGVPIPPSASDQAPRRPDEPELVARPDSALGQQAILDPEVLPGGRHALAAVWTGAHHDDATIAAIDMRTGTIRPLVQAGCSPRFSPTGHIVFARRGKLMAIAFDPDKLEVFGQPQVIVEGVLSNALGGGVHASFNADGTLVYAPGEVFEPRVSLLVARRGHGVEGTGVSGDPPLLVSDRLAFGSIALSPDGRQLVTQMLGPTDHLWVYDLQRGGSPMRITFQGDNTSPVFSRDGARLAFASKRGDKHLLVITAAHMGDAGGAGAAELLVLSHDAPIAPTSFSPDGRSIVFTRWRPAGGCEVCIAPIPDGSGSPGSGAQARLLAGGPGNSWDGALSPDGRLLAFVNDQSGAPCIFVQPCDTRTDAPASDPGARWQVTRSAGGGGDAMAAPGSAGVVGAPKWTADGGELMYRAGDSLIAVRIAIQPSFMVGRPRPMLCGRFVEPTHTSAGYEVFPDSERIIVMRRADEPEPARELCVVLNWFAELARRVPLPASMSAASRASMSGSTFGGGRSNFTQGGMNTMPMGGGNRPASRQGAGQGAGHGSGHSPPGHGGPAIGDDTTQPPSSSPRKPPPPPPSTSAGTIV